MTILVTGASGFVGRALAPALAVDAPVRAAARDPSGLPHGPNIEVASLPELSAPADFAALLTGVDAVVHLAGVAHTGGTADEVYDRVNHRAVAELAAAARRAGVRRFVLMSSIRAQSGPAADHVLVESDPPQPSDAYGRSKLAAENALRAAGVPFTILRPVLVYGDDPKGNLATLMRIAALPLPLPFGGFANRRSLLARANLVEAVRFVLAAPQAAGETYIVADPLPAPTLAEIVAWLRAAQGRSPGLLALPPALLRWPLQALSRADIWQRFGGELIANPEKLLAAGWRPPLSTRDGLTAMVQAAAPLKSGTASRSTR